MRRTNSVALRRALARVALVGVAVGGLTAVSSAPAVAAPPPTVTGYNSIPAPLPGNVISTGFEATSAAELGDSVGMTTSGYLNNAKVVLSSWGCQTRPGGVCTTTPGATFTHPLTFNVYAVGIGGQPGTLLATKTQNVAVPYRPSADPINCTGGRWFDGASCFNGFATTVTFDFSATPALLPANVIWGVAFNTTHHGYSPIGEGAPCYGTAQGCGYDSLNVGTDDNGNATPSVGTDTDSDGIVWNSTFAGFYCDGGAGGTGTFRIDTAPPSPCWSPYRPEAQLNLFNATPTLSTASVTIPEGNASNIVNVPVTLSGPSTHTITVKYKTRNGNATLSDYQAANSTLTIPAGQTSATVPITVLGDTTPEAFEHFYVDFTVPTNATLDPAGSKITSTVTLQNDDKPTLMFANLVTTEGAATAETFTLSKPYYQPVTLTLNTANNTAVAPGDYDALVNVQVTIPIGSVGPITVPLNVKMDGVSAEPLEKFTVSAASPSVSISPLAHTVSISKNNT